MRQHAPSREALRERRDVVASRHSLDRRRTGAIMCGFAGLYVMASQCYFVGRIDAAIRYTEAAEKVISTGGVKVPYASGFVGGAYVVAGQPDRWIQWCRIRQACGDDLHVFITACLLVGLTVAGLTDEAVAAAQGLTEAAEATGNPYVISFVLLAYGLAVINADPSSSLASLRQGMAIAQDSGNRSNEAHFAANLCRHEALYRDPLAAIDSFAVAIRNYHDSGNAIIRSVLGHPVSDRGELGLACDTRKSDSTTSPDSSPRV